MNQDGKVDGQPWTSGSVGEQSFAWFRMGYPAARAEILARLDELAGDLLTCAASFFFVSVPSNGSGHSFKRSVGDGILRAMVRAQATKGFR